jgi:hypothetical protein
MYQRGGFAGVGIGEWLATLCVIEILHKTFTFIYTKFQKLDLEENDRTNRLCHISGG